MSNTFISSSKVQSSDLFSLPAHVAVLLSRLRHTSLPSALHPPVERILSLVPALDANVLAATHAMVARRASLAEVRAAASAVDATLDALAVATVSSGLGTLREPFGPAGGTAGRLRALRPMQKVAALRSLLALVREQGNEALDAALARTSAAVARLASALDASAQAADAQTQAVKARASTLEQVDAGIARLRRHAAVVLEDHPELQASLFAELPAERRRHRRARKPVAVASPSGVARADKADKAGKAETPAVTKEKPASPS